MKLRSILSIFALFLFLPIACSMGGKSVVIRQDQYQYWHACMPHEIPEPDGKMCISICTDYTGSDRLDKQNKCKKGAWTTRVLDWKSEKDFNFIRDSNMRCTAESQIF